MICVFKCVACGDQMHYSIRRKMLVCDTCSAECEIENYEIENMTYEGSAELSNDIETLSCPTCGARVSILEGSAKLRCSYCQSELAAFGVHKKEYSPEKIIPCKLTYQEARVKLGTWWMNHETMPKYDEKKLKIKFQDIYVPVWLINADVSSSSKAIVAPFDYFGDSHLPKVQVKKTYTSKFSLVPFDASCHILDEQFYNIEPFHYAEMVPFTPSYLSGHAAEGYHFEPHHILPRAIGRLKGFAKEQCRDFLEQDLRGGNVDEYLYEETDVTPTEMIYALVPIWVCSYVFQGKKYNAYINGQTGKVDGTVLFAGNKFRNNVILYGVLSLLLAVAVSFMMAVFILVFFSGYSGMSTSLYLLIGPLSYIIPILSATFKWKIGTGMGAGRTRDGRKQRSLFTGGVNPTRINQEIQIKQGMKVSALNSGMVNLIFGLIATGVISLLGMPMIQSWKIDYIVVGILTAVFAIIFDGFLTLQFSKLLLLYETYRKKTDYIDYVKLGSITEVVEDGTRT